MQDNNQIWILPASGSASIPFQFPTNPPGRILVVDHDPYVCHLTADVLIRHGFEVNAAEDGAAGWEELQAYPYNLLITELDLPKITGVKLIKKVCSARLALPIVVVAKRLPARELARNLSLRLAATLLKPVAIAALLDTVKIVLRVNASPREQIAPQASAFNRMLQEIHKHYGDHACSGLND